VYYLPDLESSTYKIDQIILTRVQELIFTGTTFRASYFKTHLPLTSLTFTVRRILSIRTSRKTREDPFYFGERILLFKVLDSCYYITSLKLDKIEGE
jgi:hypothetical protein